MMKSLLIRRESALFAILIVLFAGFAFTTENFLSWFGLFEQTRYLVVTGMIAVPMTFVIATAGIDLSVGSIVALCCIVTGLLFRDAGAPIWVAALGGVLAGLLAGLFNGGISSYLGIPPLVVTLATMTLFRGAAMGLSQAESIGNFPDAFLWLSQGDLFSFSVGDDVAYFPFGLACMLAVFIAGGLLLERSWIGRFTKATGENEIAARFAAIDVRLLKCGLYTAMGLVCGVAALFQTALFATAKANTAMGLELEVIACVVVGGTRISGGQGSVLGSLLGLLIIGILRYGLDLADWEQQYIIVVVGLLLIVTAVLNEWMARRQGDVQ